MNCTEFESMVERAVDDRTSIAPAVIEHTLSCAKCRTFWEGHQRLHEAIAAWRGVQPPIGLVGSVLAELANPVWTDEPESFDEADDQGLFTDAEVPSPFLRPAAAVTAVPRKSSSGLFAVASVAACLMIVGGLTLQFVRPPASEMARATRDEQGGPAIAAMPPVDVSQTLTAVLSDLRSEYRDMASETTSVARDVVNAIPHSVGVSVLAGTEDLDVLPGSNGVVQMWQPIGSGVESALGFLWQAVPSEIPAG